MWYLEVYIVDNVLYVFFFYMRYKMGSRGSEFEGDFLNKYFIYCFYILLINDKLYVLIIRMSFEWYFFKKIEVFNKNSCLYKELFISWFKFYVRN